jgi:hypothetical protein
MTTSGHVRHRHKNRHRAEQLREAQENIGRTGQSAPRSPGNDLRRSPVD